MSRPLDLTDQRFGRLLVVARAGSNKDGRSLWRCQCSCGVEKLIIGKSLQRGLSNSCGCRHAELANRINLVGLRFGRWVVVSREKSNHFREATWHCRCACGTERTVGSRSLRRGETQSCGCLQIELRKAQKGDKNPNWRGGVTPINAGIRASKKYENWRTAVLMRDGYVCQKCGNGGALHAHHIMPFAAFPELRFAESNGQTLCIPCHEKTPSYPKRLKKQELVLS